MPKLILITLNGLEEAVVRELKLRGISNFTVSPYGMDGRVLVDVDVNFAKSLRTIERVYLLLGRCELKSLERKRFRESVRGLLREVDLESYIRGLRVISIKCYYHAGVKPKKEYEKIIAREVKRVLKDIIVSPTVGDVRLICEFPPGGDSLILGLEVSGLRPLHRRLYTVYSHPAMLNPIVAAAMILLSDVNDYSLIYDPFCGAGTIPIEAVILLSKHYRDIRILASDINPIYVKQATINATKAGIPLENMVFFIADALNPPVKEVTHIVTDPPRGRREVGISWEKIFDRLVGHLADNGRIAIILGRRVKVEDIRSRYKLEVIREINIIHGGMKAFLYILEKKQ